MDPEQFCLQWNNHQVNLVSVFEELLQREALCDVTLACDATSIRAHQMVLAACSPYFQKLFLENKCQHPIVFLKDVKFEQIKIILDYMYKGEVSIQAEDLNPLLKVAEALKIKGLAETQSKDEDSMSPVKCDLKESMPSYAREIILQKTNGAQAFTASPEKLPLRPVKTSKLLKHTPNGEVTHPGKFASNDEDQGVLIIDEEELDRSHPGDITMSPTNGDNDISYLNESDIYPMVEYGTEGGSDRNKGNGRLEWKRYKQYTRDDIMAAIEEVKQGMSALQASRKYNIPSRTLYDKVKKMGIPTANMQRIEKQKQAAISGQPSQPLINVLGLQLPQAQLPKHPLHPSQLPQMSMSTSENLATTTIHYPANTTPSNQTAEMTKTKKLLEKIDSLTREQSQRKDQTQLNLTTLLDSNFETNTQLGGETSQCDEKKSPVSEDVCIKDEKPGEVDIRAQFMADLKRPFGDKEGGAQIPVIKTVASQECQNEATDRPAQPVNLKPQQDILPAKKRKMGHEVTEDFVTLEKVHSGEPVRSGGFITLEKVHSGDSVHSGDFVTLENVHSGET